MRTRPPTKPGPFPYFRNPSWYSAIPTGPSFANAALIWSATSVIAFAARGFSCFMRRASSSSVNASLRPGFERGTAGASGTRRRRSSSSVSNSLSI